MKIKTRKNTPDGVLMYSLYGEKRDKIVLVRQYRVSIDDIIRLTNAHDSNRDLSGR